MPRVTFTGEFYDDAHARDSVCWAHIREAIDKARQKATREGWQELLEIRIDIDLLMARGSPEKEKVR